MMRVGTGPHAIIFPVRWHRATKGPLPFPSIFGSHNWYESREWLSDDLGYQGELWGARRQIAPIFNAPAYPGNPLPFGDARIWAGGYQQGDPLQFFAYPMGAFDSEFNYAYDSP